MPAKIPAFLQADDMTSTYYLSVINSYTGGPLADVKVLNAFSVTMLKIDHSMLCLLSLSITSLQFPSWHAPSADQCSVHTLNTDVYMLSEGPATVNVVKVTCLMLTHIPSQTFFRAVCLISVSLNEKKVERNFWISNDKRSSRLRQKWS